MALVTLYHHLYMGPGNNHLLNLCQSWKVSTNNPWVYLIVSREEVWDLHTLILKETTITHTILQAHIKPPGITPSTCFYLNCIHMHMEIVDCLPLVYRYKGIERM
jgi:hypothetical protein